MNAKRKYTLYPFSYQYNKRKYTLYPFSYQYNKFMDNDSLK